MSELLSIDRLARCLGRADVLVFDTRARLDDPEYGRRAYAESHIPGARFLDLEQALSGPVVPGRSGRHPLPQPEVLEARLREAGLQQDTAVVAYDDGPGYFAARLWWLLRWLGHERVQVLDGGWHAWRRAGLPVASRRETSAWPGRFVARPRPDRTIDAGTLLKHIDDGSLQLFDARSPERFRGENEPIDPVAGHIPGALCLPCAGNLAEDGCFLPAEVLRQRFPAPQPGVEAVSYCGSGITACHNILAAVEAGLPEPRLYPGSWSEWINDPARPVARRE